MSTAPETLVVVGGGLMGVGIAQVFLAAGSRVTIVDADETLAAQAAGRVIDGLAVSAKYGAYSGDTAEAATRLDSAGSIEIAPSAPLAIEAVPERPGLKRDVLARIAAAQPDAVVASNTSSISIDALAEAVESPERFLGMHFFNPVPRSRLVELVRGAATSDATIEAARGWVTSIGLEPIVVVDSPGFASSRLGVLLGLEAIRMLEEGVASAEDIDRAMVLGYSHAMGPLRSTDLVGLDVRLAIAEYLTAELGQRFEPPALLRRLVAEGRLGRKSGRGFFDWS